MWSTAWRFVIRAVKSDNIRSDGCTPATYTSALAFFSGSPRCLGGHVSSFLSCLISCAHHIVSSGLLLQQTRSKPTPTSPMFCFIDRFRSGALWVCFFFSFASSEGASVNVTVESSLISIRAAAVSRPFSANVTAAVSFSEMSPSPSPQLAQWLQQPAVVRQSSCRGLNLRHQDVKMEWPELLILSLAANGNRDCTQRKF